MAVEILVATALLCCVIALLFLAHRLLCAAEERGWIHYRKKTGGDGSAGRAFLEFQAMLEPDKRHVIEERIAVKPGGEQPGDPPEDSSKKPIEEVRG